MGFWVDTPTPNALTPWGLPSQPPIPLTRKGSFSADPKECDGWPESNVKCKDWACDAPETITSAYR